MYDSDEYDLDDLGDDLSALIDDELVSVTGVYPDLRYCLTPEGERALDHANEIDRGVRDEARELAMHRHASAQEGIVIQLFGDQGA